MGIAKLSDSDFEGLISDSDNYEDEINQIEIPHGGGGSAKRRFNNRRGGVSIGIMKINADCANCTTGRNLRRIGILADVYRRENGRLAS